ncbi:MAG: hypothetical protein OES38_15685 [Gammaproteobacteria bacterium]|nr:hypothetical protein [Gammaproteobacteria bacterium]
MQKSIDRSRQLRARLKADLFPLLKGRGFRPLKHSSLYYEFGRVSEGQLHVFEIQWDKYHRPRFVVNFGRSAIELNDEGEEGVRNPFMDVWVPVQETGTGGLAESNWLARGRLRRRWFRFGMLRGLFASEGDRVVVGRCIEMLPLVDGWFSDDPASVEVVDWMNHRTDRSSTSL